MFWLMVLSPIGAACGVAIKKQSSQQLAILETKVNNLHGIATLLFMPN